MVPCDNVVTCWTRPNTALLAELKAAGLPVVNVGDSVSPRNLHAAVREGATAAMALDEHVLFNPNDSLVDGPAAGRRRPARPVTGHEGGTHGEDIQGAGRRASAAWARPTPRATSTRPATRSSASWCRRTSSARRQLAADLKLDVPISTDYYKAFAETKPDVVSINTLVDTHAAYSIHAMKAGCHVFMEKPIAKTVREAEQVVKVARETQRKLVIGYILRVHPAWKRFIELAQTLGKPLVMRMNLNQQSYGHEWEVHKSFIANMPPLVDCGVHYVDVMCQMTRAKPVLVQGMAARVAEDIPADQANYGALQVVFDDKSVGWYEVGWGPMMSKVAFFVKDVIGPKGCVSIDKDTSSVDPSDVSKHTTVDTIILHSSAMDAQGRQATKDQVDPHRRRARPRRAVPARAGVPLRRDRERP